MKILYIHGFLSSGASGTAKILRSALPDDTILSPDVPIHPDEAIRFLRQYANDEQPQLIIGSSMGGMYAEQLYGFYRILVNPAFEIDKTLMKTFGAGRHAMLSPRQDGVQDILVNKAYVKEFSEVLEGAFSQASSNDEQDKVVGLFGRKDPLVHTRPIFQRHYTLDIPFMGEHRLNEHIVKHTLLPVINKMKDRILNRQRPILYIALDHCVYDHDSGKLKANVQHAFEILAQRYDTYLVANPFSDSDLLNLQEDDLAGWVETIEIELGVLAHRHIIFTPRPELLYGDYFIMREWQYKTDLFLGTTLHYGSPDLKDWDHILTYFDRLQGQ